MWFDPATTTVTTGKSKKGKKNGRKKSIEEELVSDADPLVSITFKELLKLNLPDWYLVVTGIIATGMLGVLFPLMSILFSGILEV